MSKSVLKLEPNASHGWEVYEDAPYPNHLGEVYLVKETDPDAAAQFDGWNAGCSYGCGFGEVEPLALDTRHAAIDALLDHRKQEHP